MDLYTALDELLAYAKEKLLLDELDEIYVRNTALGVLGAATYRPGDPDVAKAEKQTEPSALVAAVTGAAVAEGLITADAAEKTGTRLLETVSLRPSAVCDR